MDHITTLGKDFSEHVERLTRELLEAGEPESLSEMEREVRSTLLKLGQSLLGGWLAMQEGPYPAETRPCPHCGGQAEYQFRRFGVLYTILGPIGYRRAYYLCPACHRGHYPLDQKLGLRPGERSAELESLAGMTGAQLPFGQGSQLFEALTLMALSDHSLAKATQAIGVEVQAQEQEWGDQSRDEAWVQEQQRLAERPERLYGALDAAKVHVRGDKEHPWRDLKVGAWFTTTAEPPQTPEEDWEIHATAVTYYCEVKEAPAIWRSGMGDRLPAAGSIGPRAHLSRRWRRLDLEPG